MALFDWFKSKAVQDAENTTLTNTRRPFARDFTENLKVNGELTRGLYHNSYPGFKLAGAMAFAPIATPLAFMGLPVPTVERGSAASKAMLAEIMEAQARNCQAILEAAHRDGTIWVWPYYSAAEKRLVWDLILDDSVTDIIKDPDTGRMTGLVVTEQITYQSGENAQKIVTRKRSFTEDMVRDELDGKVRQAPNTYKILPIPFANLPDTGKVRGHSDLERIIPNLKGYHDVKLAWSTMLAKFKAKMVVEATSIADFKVNNGIDNLGTFDPNATDLLLLKKDQEKLDYVFLQGAGAEYEKYLQNEYYAIVQGSAIPEICWGLEASGNHASADSQVGALLQYCNRKQDQATAPFRQLFEASLLLLSVARMGRPAPVTVSWNDMDALTPTQKADILQKFADAMSKLFSAAQPVEEMFKVWRTFYPKSELQDIEAFKAALNTSAKWKAFASASYLDQQDAAGVLDTGSASGA